MNSYFYPSCRYHSNTITVCIVAVNGFYTDLIFPSLLDGELRFVLFFYREEYR